MIIPILIYAGIETVLNASNVVIYDQFPSDLYLNPYYPWQELSCQIRNNAPLTLPLVNPFYIFHVTIVDSTNDAFAYFKGSGGKQQNCTEHSVDIGKIDPGEYEIVEFYLCPDEGNVTLQTEVYLSLWKIRFKVASTSYLVMYQGNHKYTIMNRI